MSNTAEEVEETTQEVIPFDAKNITVFNEFESQLVEMIELNSKVVFDYEEKKGNKDARSHVHKLRKSKSALDKIRIGAKADASVYVKAVNEKAGSILSQIEDMIDVHMKPLDEFEERESKRVDAHKLNLMVFNNYKSSLEMNADIGSEDMKELLATIKKVIVDDTWDEFKTEALMLKDAAVTDLESRIELRIKHEETKAELTKIQKQQEETEEVQRQKEADEEEERQKVQEQEDIETHRINNIKQKLEHFNYFQEISIERTELEWFEDSLKQVNEMEITESEYQEFIDSAKLARLETIKVLEESIEAKKTQIKNAEDLQRLKDEEEQRKKDEEAEDALRLKNEKLAKNKKHREQINEGIAIAFISIGKIDEKAANDLIELINKGEVPNVTITY